MRIGLVGYGRMGREIERVASERGHEISCVFTDVDPFGPSSTVGQTEVLIDFSEGPAVMGILEAAAAMGLPVVEGTTGWYEGLDRATTIPGLTMVYSPNFSPGVFCFTQIVRIAARELGRLGAYDAYLHEWHHRGKADSPSGTARRLAEVVLEETPGKKSLLFDTCNRRILPEELHVTSTRVGRLPGTHEVGFDSSFDSIQLRHTAHSREGFALGAVLAAEWILGKSGVFTMDEFMADL